MLDIQWVKSQFPILQQTMHGKPLCFLDSAASAQKPKCVIDKIKEIYTKGYANVHRGAYQLSDEATNQFEKARRSIAEFIGANEKQIVLTKGTTESINLVAHSLAEFYFNEGDEIILSVMEHHANIVPWQMIAEKLKLKIRVIPIFEDGSLNLEAYKNLLNEKTKLVSITHVSNVLGTINPLKDIIDLAKKYNVAVCVDGAQAVLHEKIDVADLGCDFYSFSAHKLYGPTGVGALYVSDQFSQKMSPYQGGGNMISNVTFEKTTYAEFPHNFEAGTPNIADVIATTEAIEFIKDLGLENIKAHEKKLLQYATEKLSQIKGLRIIGTAKEKASMITFVIEGCHANDIGLLLDTHGVAVRTGHHCAQPLLAYYQVPSTVRASFAVYNTIEDVDTLFESLKEVIKLLV